MLAEVECYAGHKGSERPVRFRLAERDYTVIEILDRWYGPDADYFKVAASDGNRYMLRHTRGQEPDQWSVDSLGPA